MQWTHQHVLYKKVLSVEIKVEEAAWILKKAA